MSSCCTTVRGIECIDLAKRPEGYLDVAAFHPTFLYESLWNVGVAPLVIWAGRRFTPGRGRTFCSVHRRVHRGPVLDRAVGSSIPSLACRSAALARAVVEAVWSLTPDYGGSMAVPPDVLVVGAGPTGLALAAQLCAYGTRFRIVDRSLDRARKSRALAVQPRPGRPKSLPATHTVEAMSMAHRSDEHGQGQLAAPQPGHWGLGRWAARRLRASE